MIITCNLWYYAHLVSDMSTVLRPRIIGLLISSSVVDTATGILDMVGSFLLKFWRCSLVLLFDPNGSFLETKVKMLYNSRKKRLKGHNSSILLQHLCSMSRVLTVFMLILATEHYKLTNVNQTGPDLFHLKYRKGFCNFTLTLLEILLSLYYMLSFYFLVITGYWTFA